MDRAWEYHVAAPRVAPGVTSMTGYRALNVPDGVHRGMPSSMLTFIVSLDDGGEAGDTASALAVARPNPLLGYRYAVWFTSRTEDAPSE